MIAEALYPYPAHVLIATKVGAVRGADRSWQHAMRPEQLRAACEENLRQLRLEQLHLVHMRFTDPDASFADAVGALADLQREGKIRHIGVSNVTPDQLREAQSIAPIVSVQNLYNLTQRDDEATLQICTEQGIAYDPFFPLAIGQLGQPGGVLDAIAQRHQATPAQIALAWLLARSPQMLVIPGTSSRQHLEENIAAGAIRLTDDEIAEIEQG